LGTLEKRLAETQQAQRESQAPTSGPTSPSLSSTKELNGSTPHSHLASPEPTTRNGTSEKRLSTTEEEEGEQKQLKVEELSDMMCSLVTNNCGETRYIGTEARVTRK
jgi:hypothetical protein